MVRVLDDDGALAYSERARYGGSAEPQRRWTVVARE